MIGIQEGTGYDPKEKVYHLPKLDMNIVVFKDGGDVRVDIDTPSLKVNNDLEHAAMHGVLLLISTMLSEDFDEYLLADLDALESAILISLEKIPPLVEQVREKGYWLSDG